MASPCASRRRTAGASTGRRRTTSSRPARAPPRKANAGGSSALPSVLRLESVRILEVGEAGEATEEGEVDAPDRAVPLLADDHFRSALRLLLVGRVHLFAIDEEDQVGVLLDGARLAQARHHRPSVVSLLHLPCE